MADQYRAEHIGSLLRPSAVLEARTAHEQGSITLEQLREIEDEAILGALEMQRQVGIEILSDGEFRRSWFSAAFADSIEGIMHDPDATTSPGWEGEQGHLADQTTADIGFTTQMVGAKLRQVRRLTGHESSFLKQHSPGPFKITMPGVMTRARTWYKPGVTDQFYPTPADLILDIVEILRSEVRALIDEGVTYIQLDSLRYVIQLADVRTRQQMVQGGEDVEVDVCLDEPTGVPVQGQ